MLVLRNWIITNTQLIVLICFAPQMRGIYLFLLSIDVASYQKIDVASSFSFYILDTADERGLVLS